VVPFLRRLGLPLEGFQNAGAQAAGSAQVGQECKDSVDCATGLECKDGKCHAKPPTA
jgi:hypothetical protein